MTQHRPTVCTDHRIGSGLLMGTLRNTQGLPKNDFESLTFSRRNGETFHLYLQPSGDAQSEQQGLQVNSKLLCAPNKAL